MAQPNAQNSELDPQKHPSGARIEKMVSGDRENSKDKGLYGENLRPSERDDDAADVDVHRRTPSNRET